MWISVSNYYNEKTRDFKWKNILDEVEMLAFQVSHLRSLCVLFHGFTYYTYLACLKVLMWFVFAIYGLFIFMVNWEEVYSKQKVNSWKRLIFFTKRTVLDVYKDSEYSSVAWKENCKFCYVLQFEITCSFCHFSATKLQLKLLYVLGFLRP